MSRSGFFGAIAVLFFATGADAATRVWVGGQASTLWSNPANWQGGVPPVSGDRAVFSDPRAISVTVNDFTALQLEALEVASDASYAFNGNALALTGDAGLVIRSSASRITFTMRLAFQSAHPRIEISAPAGSVAPTVDFADVRSLSSLVVVAPGATLEFPAGISRVTRPVGLDITAEVVHMGGTNEFANDVSITARRFIAPGEALSRDKAVTYVRPGSGLLEFTSPRPGGAQRYDLRGTLPGSGLRVFDPVLDEVYVEGTQVIEAAQPLSLPGLLWGPGRIALEGGHRVTISGTDHLFTGGLEVRDAVLAFESTNAIPAVNDLALNGPKAVLEVGAFPLKVRNFSCNNGATILWAPSDNPLEVTGSIDVDGCILELGDVSGAPTSPELILLQNDSGKPIAGQFESLPDGVRVMVGETERLATYAGGGSHRDFAFGSAFGLGRVQALGAPILSVATGGSIDPAFSARIFNVMNNPRPGVAARATIAPANCGRFPNGTSAVALVSDAQGIVTAPVFTGLVYNRACTITLEPISGGGSASVDVTVYEPASVRLSFLADSAVTDFSLAIAGAERNYEVGAFAGGFHGVPVPNVPVAWSVQSSSAASAVATPLTSQTGVFGVATARVQPNDAAGPYDLIARAPATARALHVTQLASITGRKRISSEAIANSITLMDGGASCTLGAVDFNAPAPADAPRGWVFPRGFMRVATAGCTGSLHFRSVDTARPARSDGVYMRFGPSADNLEPHWQPLAGAFDENDSNAYTFTLVGEGQASVAYAIPAIQHQDMWWGGPAENGWGVSVVQHGDTLFTVIYAYDNAGKPTWYVMPGGKWDGDAHRAFSGALYLPHGSPFFNYNAASLVAGNAVGTASLTFVDGDHVVLQYTINGVSASKSIVRQSFGDPKAFAPVRGDMWWGGPAQNGWGIASIAQGAKLFSVWFTYDAAGAPTWFVMPDGSFSEGRRVYDGKLYRTTASAWLGVPYNPSQLQSTEVGAFRFDFSGDTARFEYSNDSHTGTLQLERQPF